MKLGESLLKKLNQKYEPSANVQIRFRGNDISFKTDEEGNPILAFVGQLTDAGTVKGERFARTLKKDQEGNIIKDHWERKGKAT